MPSKFGPAPVSDEVLLRAFLDDEPFVIQDLARASEFDELAEHEPNRFAYAEIGVDFDLLRIVPAHAHR